MSWTITFTVHLWWLWAYLAAGLVLWLPMEYVAYRSTNKPDRIGFWPALIEAWRRHPLRIPVPIVAWPASLWVLLR